MKEFFTEKIRIWVRKSYFTQKMGFTILGFAPMDTGKRNRTFSKYQQATSRSFSFHILLFNNHLRNTQLPKMYQPLVNNSPSRNLLSHVDAVFSFDKGKELPSDLPYTLQNRVSFLY
jgi:hypothetical protein